MENEIKFGLKTYKFLTDFMPYNDNMVLAKVERKGKVFNLFKYVNHFSHETKTVLDLQKFGIAIPKIIKVDKKRMLTLEEDVGNDSVLSRISSGDVDSYEALIKQLFLMYRFCRFSKISLDYMPENFVVHNGQLIYTKRDYFQANENARLENQEMVYWVPSKECYDYLKEMNMEFDRSKILSKAETSKTIVLLSVKYF